MAVNVPPGSVQHLQKIGGIVALDGKATGQSRIDVGVGVDETGHNQPASGVHIFGVGVFCLQVGLCTDLTNGFPINYDRAILQIGHCRIPGEEFSVSYQQHKNCLLWLKIIFSAGPCAKHFVAARSFNKYFVILSEFLLIFPSFML